MILEKNVQVQIVVRKGRGSEDWRQGRIASARGSARVMEVYTATARRKLSPASGEPWNNGDKSAAAPRFWSKLPVIVLFKHGPTRSAPDTGSLATTHLVCGKL